MNPKLEIQERDLGVSHTNVFTVGSLEINNVQKIPCAPAKFVNQIHYTAKNSSRAIILRKKRQRSFPFVAFKKFCRMKLHTFSIYSYLVCIVSYLLKFFLVLVHNARISLKNSQINNWPI